MPEEPHQTSCYLTNPTFKLRPILSRGVDLSLDRCTRFRLFPHIQTVSRDRSCLQRVIRYRQRVGTLFLQDGLIGLGVGANTALLQWLGGVAGWLFHVAFVCVHEGGWR